MSIKGNEDGKIISTFGAILNLFLVALPQDLWRWLHLERKCVKNHVVIVTGGASGIGLRMAEIFALDLKAKEASNNAVKNISDKGGVVKSWICDVSDANSLNYCAGQIQKELGDINIVICNAAILNFGHFLELTDEHIQQAINVNIVGTINTIRAFLKPMEEKKSGQIVAISSIAGYFGETFGMAYCPTKFAVRGIMECLRMELNDRLLDGIVCTTLCPYFVRTPMILNKGIRPTSRWISFMSIDRCAREAVDAILKEKILAFIPSWITIMPLIN